MPADVNGTINIIAEVVGKGQSPSNNANALAGKNAQETEKNRRNFLGITLDANKIKLVMFSLLSQSKVLGSTLQTTFRLLGILVDTILMPFVPILQAGMGFFTSIVQFIEKVSRGDWAGIWTDLKDWWTTAWNEGGGITGVIKAVLAGATGTAMLTALLATMLIGPRAGIWVLQKTFGAAATNGFMLSKKFIGKLIGWSSSLIRTGANAGTSVLKTVGNVLLSTAGLLKKLFWKATPMWGKEFLKNAWGLLKWGGVKLGTAVANLSRGLWSSRLLGAARIGGTAVLGWIGSLFGAMGIGAGTFGLMGTLGLIALLGTAMVVTGFFILNALTNLVLDQGLAKTWTDYVDSMFERGAEGAWRAMNIPGGGGNYDTGPAMGLDSIWTIGSGKDDPQRTGTKP